MERFVFISCQVSNGCLRLWWCGNSHSHSRSIRTRTVLLLVMPPDTKLFRATGRQRLIITSMAGQSKMKFYKDIFPISTGCTSSMTTKLGLPVRQFSKMLDFIILTTLQAKLSTKQRQIAEWSRWKKGWCQLVARVRRGYSGVVQRPSSWSDL